MQEQGGGWLAFTVFQHRSETRRRQRRAKNEAEARSVLNQMELELKRSAYRVLQSGIEKRHCQLCESGQSVSRTLCSNGNPSPLTVSNNESVEVTATLRLTSSEINFLILGSCTLKSASSATQAHQSGCLFDSIDEQNSVSINSPCSRLSIPAAAASPYPTDPARCPACFSASSPMIRVSSLRC